MNKYKIDLSMFSGDVLKSISSIVQQKAFALGYAWNAGQYVFEAETECLFMSAEGEISWGDRLNAYIEKPYFAISAESFLALPVETNSELFRIGERVEKYTGVYWRPAVITALFVSPGEETPESEFHVRRVGKNILPSENEPVFHILRSAGCIEVGVYHEGKVLSGENNFDYVQEFVKPFDASKVGLSWEKI